MSQIRPETVNADPDSWVDEYGTALFRYAMTQVRDQNVAEDLVQETFLAALNGHASFTGKSAFLTWLTTILRRRIVDYRRAQRRQAEQQQSFPPDDPFYNQWFDKRNHWRQTLGNWPTDPGEQLESSEFWEVLEKCVEQLPPPLAEAFRLREIMTWSVADVCEVVGISDGNLAIRLHRARLSLRGCLEQKWFKG